MFGWFKKKPVAEPPRKYAIPGSVEHAREILAESFEAYRLARRDRPREHNQPHAYSGDAGTECSHAAGRSTLSFAHPGHETPLMSRRLDPPL